MLHIVKMIDRRFGAGNDTIVLAVAVASALALGVGVLLLLER